MAKTLKHCVHTMNTVFTDNSAKITLQPLNAEGWQKQPYQGVARLSFGHPENVGLTRKPRSTPEEWRQSAPDGRRLWRNRK